MTTMNLALKGVPQALPTPRLVQVNVKPVWEWKPGKFFVTVTEEVKAGLLASVELSTAVAYIRLPQSPLERLKARQAGRIQRALEYRKKNGDPLENLARLLSDLVDDAELWQKILAEPYG